MSITLIVARFITGPPLKFTLTLGLNLGEFILKDEILLRLAALTLHGVKSLVLVMLTVNGKVLVRKGLPKALIDEGLLLSICVLEVQR